MLYADWRRPQEIHVWEEGWRWSYTICVHRIEGQLYHHRCNFAQKKQQQQIKARRYSWDSFRFFFFFFNWVTYFQEIHTAHLTADA